ncbi:MAG: FAD-dependent protein, partial [Planctomycetota bacterium]
ESLGPTSYPFAVRPAPLAEVLPDGALPALQAALRDFDRRLPGYAGSDAMLVGPESRSSAPLRMERDEETYVSTSHPGLYPVGEGAGWAGGIMSAAVDGLRAAEAIARNFAPA